MLGLNDMNIDKKNKNLVDHIKKDDFKSFFRIFFAIKNKNKLKPKRSVFVCKLADTTVAS